MENRYGYDSEFFDMSTNAQIYKAKSHKKFKAVVIITVIIGLTVLITGYIHLSNYLSRPKMIPIEESITTEGKYLYNTKANVTNYQNEIVKDKTLLFSIQMFVDNNGYLSETFANVYTDGTFVENYEEAYNGEYRNLKTMGNMDLTSIKNYIEENKEILVTLSSSNDLDQDHFAEDFVLKVGGKYVTGSESNSEDIYNKLVQIYNNSNKDIVQNINIAKDSSK